MNDARGGALTAEVIGGFSALVERSVIAALPEPDCGQGHHDRPHCGP